MAGRPRKPSATLASDLLVALTVVLARVSPAVDDGTSFPSTRWQADIHGFARHHFGVEIYGFQNEILTAIQDRPNIAISGGRKIGKSFMLAVAALWFYCSFPDARVFTTATALEQVDDVVWREICRLYRLAESRGTPIDGHLSVDPKTGLRASDGREVKGFSLVKPERGSGRSGINIMYIVDEASAVPDFVFDIISGNQAADGGTMRMICTSNPTRCEGRFYDIFHSHKAFWWTRFVSSEESPNVLEGRVVVPGMAGCAWIEEMKAKWGEESPHFQIHVRGRFVEGEVAAVIKISELVAASAIHAKAVGTGPLVIGCDPAGPAVGGDESAFAIRRDPKLERIDRFRGLSPAAHVGIVRGYLQEFKAKSAVVVTDASGEVGWEVLAALRMASFEPGSCFIVVPIRSNLLGRRPREYVALRDELIANLVQWIREGGAIPEDRFLHEELRAFRWRGLKSNKAELNPKTEIRERLGRSPDSADAASLAVWYRTTGDDVPAQDAPRRQAPRSDDRDEDEPQWPGDGGIKPW